MKKNILILLITIFVAALCAFCVSACRGEKGKTGDSGVNIEGAFIQDGDLYLILSSGVYVNCGNVVGSDIFNILVIIGVTAMVRPIVV